MSVFGGIDRKLVVEMVVAKSKVRVSIPKHYPSEIARLFAIQVSVSTKLLAAASNMTEHCMMAISIKWRTQFPSVIGISC